MSWSQDVYSSRATKVAYDDEKKEMIVTWKNGKSTVYFGVSEDIAQRLANAPSVGSMINAEITPNYKYRDQ